MRWSAALVGLEGPFTFLNAFVRHHDGRNGSPVCAPAGTALLSLAAVVVMLGSAFSISSRDRD